MKRTYSALLCLFIITLSACSAETSIEVASKNALNVSVEPTQNYRAFDDQIFNGMILTNHISLAFSRANDNSLPKGIVFILNSDGSFIYQNQNKENSEVTIAVLGDNSSHQAPFNIDLVFSNKTDPLYSQQWHLKSTGQEAFSNSAASVGHDINIGTLHYQGITGQGIKIAVADSGLEINHPDLRDNVLSGRSWNYITNTNNPTPTSTEGDHGTSVAGLIAAKAFNGIGGRGVAPDASILGFNILEGAWSEQAWLDTHGDSRTTDTLIVNQSYGIEDITPINFDRIINQSHEQHLAKVTKELNNKRGILLIKAAGNSFNHIETDGYHYKSQLYTTFQTTYSAGSANAPKLSASVTGIEDEASSFYHTLVSALSADEKNPHASYSTIGASMWVSAPGGDFGINAPAMITTDLMGCNRGYAELNSLIAFNRNQEGNNPNCNYLSSFNGTSSSAPLASGVAALLFSVNEQLSWRDVRHIMASTAKQIDKDFSPIRAFNNNVEFITEPGWVTNAGGYHFHNWYGFGMLDASAAVAMATSEDYQLLSALQETQFIKPTALNANISENNNNGVSNTIYIADNLTVEAIQVKISADHGRDADLAIEVTSPSGTKSMILQPQSLLIADQMDNSKGANFDNTVLLSNAFYGENSQGDWLVKVIDTNSGVFTVFASQVSPLQQNGNWVQLDFPNNKNLGALTALSLRVYGHK